MARTLYFLRAVALCSTLTWQAPALATSEGADATTPPPAPAPADGSRVSLNWKDVPLWVDVMARAGNEETATHVCSDDASPDSGDCRYAAWRNSLPSLRNLPAIERVNAVQTAINRLPYVSDRQNWSMSDRWATPAEMFARGGDCEDYALTKYFALRELGFPDGAIDAGQ
ncbi:MAG: hypothetical protein EON93_18085, partial [Burkholderiales bacterium]